MPTPENIENVCNHIQEVFALNEHSVSDPFALWNSHKVYIRGILLRMSSVAKKSRTQKLNDLLNTIQNLEKLNKQQASTITSSKLFKARQELRLFFISHDRHLRLLKSNHYCNGNKAGRLLACQIKENVYKQKIAHLQHPSPGVKLTNPKEIADVFSAY